MGWLLLFGDNADFDLPEAGRFEPAVQIALGKAQPKIAVQFAGVLEFVLQQVEDHDLATRFENSVNGRDGFARGRSVMQRLAQYGQVHAGGINGRILDIAEPELQILEVVLFRLARAEFHHLLRVVHRDDLFAAARQQFAEQAFSGAQIRHRQWRKYPQEQMTERLPRTARTVTAVEAPRSEEH